MWVHVTNTSLKFWGMKGDEDTKRQINPMTKTYSWILGGTRAAGCLAVSAESAQSPGTKWAAWPRDRLETKDFC